MLFDLFLMLLDVCWRVVLLSLLFLDLSLSDLSLSDVPELDLGLKDAI
jgi:hypothetical protein